MINQQIIFSEILEKDYDIEEFMEYLRSFSEEAAIEKLDYKFLKQKIRGFQRLKESKEINEGVSQILQMTQKKEVSEQQISVSKIFSEQNKNFEIQSQNVQQKTEFFQTKNVHLKIIEGQKKRVSMIKTENNFVIQTFPFHWKVERTFDDFIQLQQTLEQQYPLVCVPVLDEKRYNFISKFPQDFKIQEIYFQSFLDSLIRNPFFKNSNILQSFLRENKFNPKFEKQNLQNYYQFTKRNFQYEKTNFFEEMVQQFPSFEQTVEITDSKLINDFTNDLENYLDNYYSTEQNIVNLQRKIQSKLTSLEDLQKELSLRIQDLSLLESLSLKYKLPITNEITSSHFMFKKINEINGEITKSQKLLYEGTLANFLAFHRQETNNLIKFCQCKNQHKKTLQKLQQQLLKKNQWGKQTEKDFRIFVAYLNTMTYNNFKQTYRTKNSTVEEALSKLILQQFDKQSELLDQLKNIKEIEYSEQEQIELSLIQSNFQDQRFSKKQWKSIIHREEMEKLSFDDYEKKELFESKHPFQKQMTQMNKEDSEEMSVSFYSDNNQLIQQ